MAEAVEKPLTPIPAAPVVRVVATDAGRAAHVASRLEGRAEVRVAGGAGISVAHDGAPADAVLVVVEGFEAVLAGLRGHHTHLIALDPGTPESLGGRTILPAWAPGMLETLVDLVAERSAALRRAQAAEASFESLLESEPGACAIVDAEGRTLLANEACHLLLGLLATGETFPIELIGVGARVVCHQNNSIAVIQSRVDFAGRPAALIRMSRAATDEGFDGRLAHQDRLAAVGALAAGFAHEVNNPAQAAVADLTHLTELLSGLELASARLADLIPEPEREPAVFSLGIERGFEDARNLVQECFEGLGRISSLVRDLKSFSRIVPDRVDWVHPNEVVNQACALAHNHVRHRARLVKDLGALEGFPGDRNKLVQVVTNLLVNAAQALREEDKPGRVLIRTRSSEGRITISVIDSGIGIAPEVLARIFEPFFTTKQDVGTGLGLALSLDIARQHGGTLEVETEVGVGTRFDLILPIRNGLEVAPKKTRSSAKAELRSGRVLIVDDEPGIRRSLGRLIGRNHAVETRADGQEALRLLAEDQAFDVILCDLMMPGLDGPGVHEAVLRDHPRLVRRLVFMSGGAFTERTRSFLDQAKPVVLDKPAPAGLLEQAIQTVLAQPSETLELPPLSEGPPTRSFA